MADITLADSGAIARRLRTLDPVLEPVVVGVPIDLDPPEMADPWPGRSGPVVGFVGRLEPRKGVHDLLAAVPGIRAGAPGVTVVLAGDEPFGTAPRYTREILARARLLGVEHLRWVDNAPGLMRHLDVLVLPSYAEPFGTVLAEAMAVGTPVVASAADGLAEVVADGVVGRLVRPGDPAGLAAGVLEVLAQRDAMAAAARRHATRWDAEHYVDQIAELLAQRIGALA